MARAGTIGRCGGGSGGSEPSRGGGGGTGKAATSSGVYSRTPVESRSRAVATSVSAMPAAPTRTPSWPMIASRLPQTDSVSSRPSGASEEDIRRFATTRSPVGSDPRNGPMWVAARTPSSTRAPPTIRRSDGVQEISMNER